MDPLQPQRHRVEDDLRGLVSGEVRCDPSFLQLFATDGSVYEIRPLAVVRPRSSADVVACVQYAAAAQIPVHARGAGSGVAGESLGPGLVLDFSKYMRRVLHIDGEMVRVQPGLVHERLNAQLERQGRQFGPGPANSNVTTIGGMIGIDAAGSRRLKYGSTRRHVLSLQVVLADGTLMEVGQEAVVPSGSEPASRKQQLVGRLAEILTRHADAILRHRARQLPAQCGYHLTDVLANGQLDLARLLVGAEGTLALVTEATLATQPLPRYRGVALLMFDSLEKAARTVPDLMLHQPSACDLLDCRHLRLVCEADPQLGLLVAREAEAVLLVEQEGLDPVEVRQKLHAVVDEVCHQRRLALGFRQTFEPSEVDLYWRLAARSQPAFYRLKGPTRPLPVAEDMAVPPELLGDFFVRLQNVLKRHEVTASIFAHAGLGRVHLRPFLELTTNEHVRTMRALADEVYGVVLEMGGVVGGENGCGLSRTPYLPAQYGELYAALREVKEAFDPGNILNPGKIVGNDPELHTRNIRCHVTTPPAVSETPPDAQPALRKLVELQVNWDPDQVLLAAQRCNGCGDCRTQAAETRMCPLFRFQPAEEASPRAKANLLRGLLSGRLDLDVLTSDELKATVDLCVHCHMCRLECPAAVDIPRLMREAKGAHVAAKGLPLEDWLTTRLDLVGALASRVSPLANWMLQNRSMRWLLEKATGVAQGRKLPRVAPRSFVRRTARRRWGRPSRRSGPKVLYFVDVYANYYDLQLGESLLAVMEHNHVEVYVHPEQKQAGMPAVARGALDFARKLAAHNVPILADAIRQGYQIVCTEPSATLCLTREYPQLLDDDDARLVAAHTSEACTYLWKMHTLGKLQLDFKPISTVLAYHAPCHLKALEVGTPGANLLALIPGLQVHRIEAGCSGMAGIYGLLQKNYRTSLRAGWGLISRLRDPEILAGATECCTCKIQMEQGTTKPTIHPIKVLALAYGLMPALSNFFATPGKELVVT
jgi:FAD/FMN-containing dehydrogenase/Fe-S oxidoreductase